MPTIVKEASTPDGSGLVVALDGFEGPLHLLLSLARAQKVDLSRISVLALAEQYLAFIARAEQLELELAAGYLVMAAWLTYLKSRLLLPDPEGVVDDTTAEDPALLLTQRLRVLDGVRRALAMLWDRPHLGRDVLGKGQRGDAEAPAPVSTAAVGGLNGLLMAWADVQRRLPAPYRPRSWPLYSVEDALSRMEPMIAGLSDWTEFTTFVGPTAGPPLAHRSAMASTLIAALELARQGRIDIRQDRAFDPVWIRSRPRR